MIEEMDVEGWDEIDVRQSHYAEATAPQRIGTTGLGPCIGLAIMDDAQARAWIVHAPNMVHSEDDLRGLLHYVARGEAAGWGIRVVLVGGDDGDEDHRIEVLRDRSCTERAVVELLPQASVKVQWGSLGRFMLAHDGKVWREQDRLPSFEPPA